MALLVLQGDNFYRESFALSLCDCMILGTPSVTGICAEPKTCSAIHC